MYTLLFQLFSVTQVTAIFFSNLDACMHTGTIIRSDKLTYLTEKDNYQLSAAAFSP